MSKTFELVISRLREFGDIKLTELNSLCDEHKSWLRSTVEEVKQQLSARAPASKRQKLQTEVSSKVVPAPAPARSTRGRRGRTAVQSLETVAEEDEETDGGSNAPVEVLAATQPAAASTRARRGRKRPEHLQDTEPVSPQPVAGKQLDAVESQEAAVPRAAGRKTRARGKTAEASLGAGSEMSSMGNAPVTEAAAKAQAEKHQADAQAEAEVAPRTRRGRAAAGKTAVLSAVASAAPAEPVLTEQPEVEPNIEPSELESAVPTRSSRQRGGRKRKSTEQEQAADDPQIAAPDQKTRRGRGNKEAPRIVSEAEPAMVTNADSSDKAEQATDLAEGCAAQPVTSADAEPVVLNNIGESEEKVAAAAGGIDRRAELADKQQEQPESGERAGAPNPPALHTIEGVEAMVTDEDHTAGGHSPSVGKPSVPDGAMASVFPAAEAHDGCDGPSHPHGATNGAGLGGPEADMQQASPVLATAIAEPALEAGSMTMAEAAVVAEAAAVAEAEAVDEGVQTPLSEARVSEPQELAIEEPLRKLDDVAGADSSSEADPSAASDRHEATKSNGIAANLVSTIRSFLPIVKQQEAPPANGKKAIKVRALEAAEAARRKEEEKAVERAKHRLEIEKQRQERLKAKQEEEQRRYAEDLQRKDELRLKREQETAHRRKEKEAAERREKEEKARRMEEMRQKQKEETAALVTAVLHQCPSKIATFGSKPVAAVPARSSDSAQQAVPEASKSKQLEQESKATRAAGSPAEAHQRLQTMQNAAQLGATASNLATTGGPSMELKPLALPVLRPAQPQAQLLKPVASTTEQPASSAIAQVQLAPLKYGAPSNSLAPVQGIAGPNSSKPLPALQHPRMHQGGQHGPAQNYEISPYKSDFESDDEQPKKPVPEWAKGKQLMSQLVSQMYTDPDEIFQQHQKTCSLDEVFAHHEKPGRVDFNRRTSSGNWIDDRVTWKEELNYKKAMGYM